jgi:hypothetical protein
LMRSSRGTISVFGSNNARISTICSCSTDMVVKIECGGIVGVDAF